MVTITTAQWARSSDAESLVIALHGRGASEESMAGLAPYLPEEFDLVALRAPIAEGGGYAWFANRGIGRPIAESIAESVRAIEEWIDAHASRYRRIVLVGFSGGTAMAGGLILADRSRYAGAVLLSGTLPWDDGFATDPGVLAGFPVFWGADPADEVIPVELMARSASWLAAESGANLTARQYPGTGHGISLDELRDVEEFLQRVSDGRVSD